MLVECTHCHARVDAKDRGGFVYSAGDNYDPGRYLLLQCPSCDAAILAIQEISGWTGEEEKWSDLTVLYPQSDLRVNPKAPHEIRDAVEEGIKCYRAKAFTATAIMCRKALEGVCDAHGVKERALDASLKKMRDTDMIDKRLYDWSDQLRMTGNEAAHGVGVVSSSQDARDALDFTIGIIDYLFSYRDQFGVWGATERKTHVRARNGRRELIADYIRFLRMGDDRANCIRDRHCHLVEFR